MLVCQGNTRELRARAAGGARLSALGSATDRIAMVRYVIDAGKSRFVVRAFATGLLSSLGHNPTIAIREFRGEVTFAPDVPSESSLKFIVDPRSLCVTDDVNDKDRREIERQIQEDVLESQSYPQIIFESGAISTEKMFAAQYRANISGRLSLHGVTRAVAIAAQVIAGEDTLRANGEFSISQAEYGIKKVTALGGSIKLKDELKFSFDIVAHRQA